MTQSRLKTIKLGIPLVAALASCLGPSRSAFAGNYGHDWICQEAPDGPGTGDIVVFESSGGNPGADKKCQSFHVDANAPGNQHNWSASQGEFRVGNDAVVSLWVGPNTRAVICDNEDVNSHGMCCNYPPQAKRYKIYDVEDMKNRTSWIKGIINESPGGEPGPGRCGKQIFGN
jgi:hypothetical protein